MIKLRFKLTEKKFALLLTGKSLTWPKSTKNLGLNLLKIRCYDNEVPDIEVPDIEVPDIEVPDPSKDIEVPVTLRSQTLKLITNLSLLT